MNEKKSVNEQKRKVSLSYRKLKSKYSVGEECVFYVQNVVSKIEKKKRSKKTQPRVFSVALDCSGSMCEPAGVSDSKGILEQMVGDMKGATKRSTRLDECKNALNEMIDNLEEKDFLSLTLFSTQAHIVFPQKVMTKENKQELKDIVQKVVPGGSTALFEGWLEAAQQASGGLANNFPSRVILLTDGEATTEKNIDKISAAVENLKTLGVSTTCFGVGVGFNEDLLIAMSRKGDGNFRYIPDALMAKKAAIDELGAFSKTIGTNVVLEIEGNVECQIVGMDKNSQGKFDISNLISEHSNGYIIKTQKITEERDVELTIKLSWENIDGSKEEEVLTIRQEICAVLNEKLQEDEVVNNQYLSALATDRRRQMAKAVDYGNWSIAGEHLIAAKTLVESMSSKGLAYENEIRDLNKLESYIENKQANLLRKESVWQTYARTENQSIQSTGVDKVDKNE